MNLELRAQADPEWEGSRIDKFLKATLGDEISRATVQHWIDSGWVKGNSGRIIDKSSYKVTSGEIFEISVSPKPPLNLEPIQMDLEVLKETINYMIIRKPPGIASHSGPGDRSATLVNGLLYKFKELSQLGGEARPGIVHRLDKPTEGLMLIAKNDVAHAKLSDLFRKREITKKYLAWTQGSLPEGEGTIDLPIGRHPTERLKMTVSPKGRPSVTHYKVLKTLVSKSGRKFSLVEALLETGRTHQIRVHMQSQRSPVVGDLLYSRNAPIFESFGLLLVSYHLEFTDPFSGEEVRIILPIPERFIRFETSTDRF
ncbi:pseudouridine synthase, RluA family [Leptospira broomii serovar Hurstbridge str. 5399]|uniref:Pseudouridine synthase n=1 Tax=Leptospira broomii serovar Hurstbridge str. 5399 TaxID=1049789 RepID=T0EYT2_9LEPT|nr:RluA family pseudouridine synthase [Leptospira broomii]EQA44020.1 pseudouridine synthase, RluA family [Leptospira broomii serovar Hurstbridge str. 5399]